MSARRKPRELSPSSLPSSDLHQCALESRLALEHLLLNSGGGGGVTQSGHCLLHLVDAALTRTEAAEGEAEGVKLGELACSIRSRPSLSRAEGHTHTLAT